MRYLARFILVCLLTENISSLIEVKSEMKKTVRAYEQTFQLPDSQEWWTVLSELDQILMVNTMKYSSKVEQMIQVSYRLHQNYFSVYHRINKSLYSIFDSEPRYHLKEAIITGNKTQIKFSEMLVDLLRFTELLEIIEDKDPTELIQSPKYKCPHKLLLYRPTISQFLTTLSSTTSILESYEENSALLLYISAEGFFSPLANIGGAQLNPTFRDLNSFKFDSIPPNVLSSHDLLPFTRSPCLLIVDSSSSFVFQEIPPIYGKSFICLSSPQNQFPGIDPIEGGIFTLFLTNPIYAICKITSIRIPQEQFETAILLFENTIQKLIFINLCDLLQNLYQEFNQDQLMFSRLGISENDSIEKQTEISTMKLENHANDNLVIQEENTVSNNQSDWEKIAQFENLIVLVRFLDDPFFRTIILRFIFFEYICKTHRELRSDPDYWPKSTFRLPNDFLNNPKLKESVEKLLSFLDCSHHFI
eukprot:Anaeramoba_ignava/a490553_29.p1 GENE.a490553_29~~a490553_29.p1  ORF type:complete len:474 (+),score=158.56 a490553_29:69-1490(+)